MHTVFWKRFAASTIDGLILTVAIKVAQWSAPHVPESNPEALVESSPAWVMFVLVVETAGAALMIVTLMWTYFAAMESSKLQASVGKLALGLKVTDLYGRRVSFGRASGRFFGKYLSTFLLGIGYLMAAFTFRRQALHDLIAGCLVVDREQPHGLVAVPLIVQEPDRLS